MPNIEAFLGSKIRVSLRVEPFHSCLNIIERRIFQSLLSTHLDQDIQHLADFSPLRHPIAQTAYRWYGNI